MAKISSVEEYIALHNNWKELLLQLHEILLACSLEETIKWNAPVFMMNGKNVIGMAAFKNHACLWFFQGVFLQDKAQKLTNAQEGKTKALRQWRFETNKIEDKQLLKAYILEAIQNQKLGKEIKPTRTNKKLVLPQLLKEQLLRNNIFNKKFNALSIAKQREYATYIDEAKKENTKFKRLEKIIPMINEGKGLYDKYKKC